MKRLLLLSRDVIGTTFLRICDQSHPTTKHFFDSSLRLRRRRVKTVNEHRLLCCDQSLDWKTTGKTLFKQFLYHFRTILCLTKWWYNWETQTTVRNLTPTKVCLDKTLLNFLQPAAWSRSTVADPNPGPVAPLQQPPLVKFCSQVPILAIQSFQPNYFSSPLQLSTY